MVWKNHCHHSCSAVIQTTINGLCLTSGPSSLPSRDESNNSRQPSLAPIGGDFAARMTSRSAAANPQLLPPSDLSHINVETELSLVGGGDMPRLVAMDQTHVAMDQTHVAMDQNHGVMDQTHGVMDQTHVAMDQTHVAMDQTHVAMDQTHVTMDAMDQTAPTVRMSGMDQIPVSMEPMMAFNTLPVLNSTQVLCTAEIIWEVGNFIS